MCLCGEALRGDGWPLESVWENAHTAFKGWGDRVGTGRGREGGPIMDRAEGTLDLLTCVGVEC